VPGIQFTMRPLALHITHKLHVGFLVPAVGYTAGPLGLNHYLADRMAGTSLFAVAAWGMCRGHIVGDDKVAVDRSITPLQCTRRLCK